MVGIFAPRISDGTVHPLNQRTHQASNETKVQVLLNSAAICSTSLLTEFGEVSMALLHRGRFSCKVPEDTHPTLRLFIPIECPWSCEHVSG